MILVLVVRESDSESFNNPERIFFIVTNILLMIENSNTEYRIEKSNYISKIIPVRRWKYEI